MTVVEQQTQVTPALFDFLREAAPQACSFPQARFTPIAKVSLVSVPCARYAPTSHAWARLVRRWDVALRAAAPSDHYLQKDTWSRVGGRLRADGDPA